MQESRYLDFDLSIERVGEDAYRARVLSSPAGLARVDFTLPVSTLESDPFLYLWLSLLGLPTGLIAGIWMFRTVQKAT